MKAIKYRVHPNTEQMEKLSIQFGCARFVYNDALAKKRDFWNSGAYNISRFELQAMLKTMKQDLDTVWLKKAHSQVLQSALLNLDKAFTNFFQGRAKFPRFKKKNQKQSIQYPQSVKIESDKIYLPKVGWVKCVVHRQFEGKVKTVTISKSPSGKYYASVLIDNGLVEAKPIKHIEKVVGLDMGIHDFIADSHGNKTPNPRFLNKQLSNLKRKQQNLSRTKKGSKGRANARLLVAKAHEKVAFARNDFQHKLSKILADENQAVMIEDLNIKGMTKNRKLARHIQDLGWHGFSAKLGYKLKAQGKHLVKIDRWYPSSKTCSCCGHKQETMPLNIRNWQCQCGAIQDRDVNAANNIANQGIIKLKADGYTVSASGGMRKSCE
ncbi:MAG: IS200/IS605 family element transposase accessory protein TnpB [Candidatus Scalindua sp.]|nr:IS200/IS605 family element transposase accessory protein TnpB [Candidatus Scalindua sp.]